jgi:diaminopimelate epimerase
MINFSKMHSLGNDFMVIDAVSEAVTLKPEHIAQWSDRQRGIGFDQLLMVAPPSAPDCDFDYVIFNADGGEAEQCGNGTRCVTDFVHRRGLTQQNQLNWHSNGGIVRTAIRDDGMIETWLPEPQFQHAAVPFLHTDADESAGQCVALQTERGEFQVVPVSMGNPHGVVFVDDVIGLDVVGIGHALSNHKAFPNRANIGFCQIVNEGFIRLRVFERGASETQACGSGASAAVAVGRQINKLNSKVKVSLPGGKLRVEWPSSEGPIKLVGDSTFVYTGQLDI